MSKLSRKISKALGSKKNSQGKPLKTSGKVPSFQRKKPRSLKSDMKRVRSFIGKVKSKFKKKSKYKF